MFHVSSISLSYYLQRNVETGEEPDCVALWELTHTKNGTWSNKDSEDVYVSKLMYSVILVSYFIGQC